ncbi:Ornithine decarboxylase [Balamuthia mandrillaris]
MMDCERVVDVNDVLLQQEETLKRRMSEVVEEEYGGYGRVDSSPLCCEGCTCDDSDGGSSSGGEEQTVASGLRLVFSDVEGGIKAVVVDNIPETEAASDKKKKARRKPKCLSEKQKQKRRERKKAYKKRSKDQIRHKRSRTLSAAGVSLCVEVEEVAPVHEPQGESEYASLREKVLVANAGHVPISRVDVSTKVEDLLSAELAKGRSTAFYVTDLTNPIEKYLQWKRVLPRVHPFYAVKCNPDPVIVRSLVTCGTGLDCASQAEMQLALELGLAPENIIFAHPCKNPVHLQFAKENGIRMMTFDNASELIKIHKLYPEAELVLRILSDDSHSIMRFGSKFGASLEDEVPELLTLARKLDLNVIGISFHVGSGCLCAEGFINSLMMARTAFDIAKEQAGYDFTLLDIGGGWPGVDTEELRFSDMAEVIRPVIDEHFGPHVRVIAEPGRYFASDTVTLAANIVSRRERVFQGKRQIHYYLSDGVYGSFNNIIFDHAKPTPAALRRSQSVDAIAEMEKQKRKEEQEEEEEVREEMHCSTLFGPTCDSLDIICKDVDLPFLETGDWLYFVAMGAYTSSAASSFNGFCPPTSTYIIT